MIRDLIDSYEKSGILCNLKMLSGNQYQSKSMLRTLNVLCRTLCKMQISFLHSITKEGISTIFDSLGAVAEWLAHLTAKQQASHSSVATSFF